MIEAKNMRMFLIDKMGVETELTGFIRPIRHEIDMRLPAFEMPTEFPDISFRIHHITRRQHKTWLKLAGLPSGRRLARRRHKRGLK